MNGPTRDQAVRIIEDLFPADSEHLTTATIGHELLDQARRDCTDWRNERIDILLRYAELCQQKEYRLQQQANRNAEHQL